MERRKILIVEDDKFFRELLYKKLTKENFEIFLAKDSQEAFAHLESSRPDLIILDLILPGMDGYDILSILKKDKKTSGIPVIVLSNLGQEEEIERAKSLGAAEFMTKINFTLEEIAEKIRQFLREKYL